MSEHWERSARAVSPLSFVVVARLAQAGLSPQPVRLARLLLPEATFLALGIPGRLMQAAWIDL